jgi:hypothetical protein
VLESFYRRFIEDGLPLDALMDYAKVVGKKYHMGRRESEKILQGELSRIASPAKTPKKN